MSTPNPLAPQGSLLEQQGRGKSTVQIITFIGALHVFFLCGLLWIGCKKDDHPQTGADPLAPNPSAATGIDSNSIPPIAATVAPSNPAPAIVAPAVTSGVPLVGLPPVAPEVRALPPVTPPAQPADVAPTAASDYKIQKGDTGVTIARKNNVTLAALKAANPNVKWTALKVDQHVQIPASDGKPAATHATPVPPDASPAAAEGTVYEVKPGDTGSKIAHKFGVPWKAIRAANQLSSDVLKPKQKLTIPAKAAGRTPAPAESAPAPASASPVVPSATPIAPSAPSAIPAPGR